MTLPSFLYTSGSPDNLVGGQPASMNDIQGPFYDLQAYLNNALRPILETAGIVINTGDLKPTALPYGSGAPAGWLFCQGQLIDRTTYADLFTAIGTTYGAGNGTTTFAVPDLRGCSPLGAGSGSMLNGNILTARAVGDRNGQEQLALTINQMPDHIHQYSDATPSKTGVVFGSGSGVPPAGVVDGSSAPNKNTLSPLRTDGSNPGTLSQPHNNMPPFLVINWLIKT